MMSEILGATGGIDKVITAPAALAPSTLAPQVGQRMLAAGRVAPMLQAAPTIGTAPALGSTPALAGTPAANVLAQATGPAGVQAAAQLAGNVVQAAAPVGLLALGVAGMVAGIKTIFGYPPKIIQSVFGLNGK